MMEWGQNIWIKEEIIYGFGPTKVAFEIHNSIQLSREGVLRALKTLRELPCDLFIFQMLRLANSSKK